MIRPRPLGPKRGWRLLADYIHNKTVFRSDRFSIENVCCRAASPDCSATECTQRPSIAFVRSGVFRKHLGRADILADANHVVFFNAGEEYRVSHPVAGGDDCTSLSFEGRAWQQFAVDAGSTSECPDHPFALIGFVCSSPTALRLHRLLGRISQGHADPFEVQEEGLALLAALAGEARAAQSIAPPRVKSSTRLAHRRLVERARELIACDPGAPLSLQAIADAVGSSPYHLVRIFHSQSSLPLHRYRNQLRLRLALEHVGQGDRDLTAVALRLGFASHSHFTDSFRREFGLSPSRLRRSAR